MNHYAPHCWGVFYLEKALPGLKTKFILFEKNNKQENRHLCIAGNQTNGYYPETFFYEQSDYYIKNQTLEKIKQFQIIKTDGSIFFEDNF